MLKKNQMKPLHKKNKNVFTVPAGEGLEEKLLEATAGKLIAVNQKGRERKKGDLI